MSETAAMSRVSNEFEEILNNNNKPEGEGSQRATGHEDLNEVVELCRAQKWKEIEALGTPLDGLSNRLPRGLVRYLIDEDHGLTPEDLKPLWDLQPLQDLDVRGNDFFERLHIAAKVNRWDFGRTFSTNTYNRADREGRIPAFVAVENCSHKFLKGLLSQQGVRWKRRVYCPLTDLGFDAPPTSYKDSLSDGKLLLSPTARAILRDCATCLKHLSRHNNGHQWERDGKSILNEHVEGLGTLLHLAIAFKGKKALTDILENRRKVIKPVLDRGDPFGRTPVALAAAMGDKKSVKLLHKAGANLSKKDHKGWPPLHHAMANNHHAVSEYLIRKGGVDVEQIDDEGRTADEVARENRANTVVIREARQRLQIDAQGAVNYREMDRINLVFQGGGVKGMAYFGVLQVLKELGMLSITERAAGSSAGAITAMLVATGCTQEKMKEYIVDKSLKDLRDPAWPRMVVERAGLYKGEKLREWIEKIMHEMTQIEFCTFGELTQKVHDEPERFKHLHVFAQGIDGEQPLEQISTEDPKWESYIVSDAVRASAGFPVVFQPHRLRRKEKNLDGTFALVKDRTTRFIDGGTLANLPMIAFDRQKYINPTSLDAEEPAINQRTLGLSLAQPEDANRRRRRGRFGIGKLLERLAGVETDAQVILQKFEHDKRRIAEISAAGVKTLDFSVSDEEKLAMIKAGIHDICAFLQVDEEVILRNVNDAEQMFPSLQQGGGKLLQSAEQSSE
jgi:predicted acylesterase/phospholipase RssA